jgi:hypothetical protein
VGVFLALTKTNIFCQILWGQSVNEGMQSLLLQWLSMYEEKAIGQSDH